MSYLLPITNFTSVQYAERMLHRSKGLPRISSVIPVQLSLRDARKKEQMLRPRTEYIRNAGCTAGLYVNELI
ncbi:hypothetical protein ACFQPF_09120 [Fictibacillus iocasae]|uniref:Uncharacterized protein n=1 Tax=Fictibacillus iocasae TaxID=2715437 RepID=A0ABW2NRN8_9BACL